MLGNIEKLRNRLESADNDTVSLIDQIQLGQGEPVFTQQQGMIPGGAHTIVPIFTCKSDLRS